MTARRRSATADEDADLKVRASWLYYIEGLTQEQIADHLRLSRVKVMRLLASAREENIVRIKIDVKGAEQIELERRLEAALGLSQAVVVPTPTSEIAIPKLVGHAAGAFLADTVRDGMSIAVGWGETLSMALAGLARRPTSRVSIVSLLGGMTHSRAINPSAVARRVADVFGAECFQLTAPVLVSSEEMRVSLWREPGLQELLDRARRADVALVSVGNVTESDTLFREGLLPRAELEPLRRAGAVGDVLCHFLDAEGRLVDHSVNRRVMAVSIEDVRRIPVIAVAAGGVRKVPAIRAVLRATGARVLITDTEAARRLVRAAPELAGGQGRARKPRGSASQQVAET